LNFEFLVFDRVFIILFFASTLTMGGGTSTINSTGVKAVDVTTKEKSTSSSSLLRSLGEEEARLSRQSLAGRTYEIDTARFEDGESSSSGLIQKAVKATAFLLLSPVLFVAGSVATMFMYVGPSSWKQSFLSWWLPRICGRLNEKFGAERQHLLADCGTTTTEGGGGGGGGGDCRVLDVGSGGGAYMQYLRTATHITALEPVAKLHPTIRKTAELHGIQQDRLDVLAMNVETYLREHGNKTLFDWVILGNVLCEVDNVATTLDAVDQLLQPGTGRVYFSEHVACPHGSWRRRVQQWINPVWHTISGGCNLHHDSLEAIQAMPNWQVISWTYHNFTVGMGPFVLGLALKTK
jgi:SAM-dependent methyltransferase